MDRKTFFKTIKERGLFFNLRQCANCLCQGQNTEDAIWNRFQGCKEEDIISIAMKWREQLNQKIS